MFGKIKITDFGKRHFDQKFGGTKITNKTPEEFESILNDILSMPPEGGLRKILDGYAPFCKLVVIPNFTNARVGSMKIDIANYQYLRSGYSSRTPKELPVMSRWFELPVSAPIADYLVIVLYSKEQIDKEEGNNPNEKYIPFDSDWGIVAILAQTHDEEEPMQPITMMRNALGIEEGGSGVPLDKNKYSESVKFWSDNAIIKS